MTDSDAETRFAGAKIALFIGDKLLIFMRDDFDTIPFPGCWDFPGGTRDPNETPEDCALRETWEEFGLTLVNDDLCYRVHHHEHPSGQPSWFFAAHLPPQAESRIRFGDEGQYWRLIPPTDYADLPDAIPHLASLLQGYLARRA